MAGAAGRAAYEAGRLVRLARSARGDAHVYALRLLEHVAHVARRDELTAAARAAMPPAAPYGLVTAAVIAVARARSIEVAGLLAADAAVWAAVDRLHEMRRPAGG